MAKRPLVTVAGVALPTPSTYVGTEATIVDSQRNVEGFVVGSVVRESVAKVELTWKYITAGEWAQVMRLFNTAYGGSFYNSVDFFNQLTGGWSTRDMYVSDRTNSGAFMLDPATGAVTGYTGARLALIEV